MCVRTGLPVPLQRLQVSVGRRYRSWTFRWKQNRLYHQDLLDCWCERGDISQVRRNCCSNRRWTNQNTWRRSGLENIHLGAASDQFKERVILFFLENQKGLFHNFKTHFPDVGASMSGNFIHRHHVEPTVKLYSPRNASCLVPLKFIDASRATHTNWVKQKKRIDDYWNIDGSRDLSPPLDGFHTIYYTRRKSSQRKHMVRGETNEETAYSQIGNQWERTPSWRKRTNGLKTSSFLTMHENFVESGSSTPRIRNEKKPSRTRVRSWKHKFALAMIYNCEEQLWEWCIQQEQNKICTPGKWWMYDSVCGKFVAKSCRRRFFQEEGTLYHNITIWIFKFFENSCSWSSCG